MSWNCLEWDHAQIKAMPKTGRSNCSHLEPHLLLAIRPCLLWQNGTTDLWSQVLRLANQVRSSSTITDIILTAVQKRPIQNLKPFHNEKLLLMDTSGHPYTNFLIKMEEERSGFSIWKACLFFQDLAIDWNTVKTTEHTQPKHKPSSASTLDTLVNNTKFHLFYEFIYTTCNTSTVLNQSEEKP